MSKPINQTEPRIYGNWEPTVDVKSHGPSKSTLRRKVVARKRAFCKVNLDNIVAKLRQGYEVILTDDTNANEPTGIRLYHCMDKGLTHMFVAAQTVGAFRKSISDIKFTVRRNGLKATKEECERMVLEAVERHETVKREAACPTRIVTCPKCGYDFEIGGLKAK